MITQTGIVNDDVDSAVSWGAILAGATASAAITLVLVAFGFGVGFSVVSPWSGEGVSATTFTLSAGIYLIVIAMLSSTFGGYLAGRLRTRWQTVHEHERYFRDSAHGVVTWALATVVTAAVLGGATTAIIGATGAGLAAGAPAAARSAVTDGYIDSLMRPAPGRANAASTARAAQSPAQVKQQATDQATSPVATDQTAPNLQGGQIAAPVAAQGNVNRGEIGRILATGLTRNGSVADADRTYLASIVASRTGLSQAEAEQRVNQTITQAKAAADSARKSARNFAFWLAFAMLAGALSAALAAIEGGNLRNREWYLTDAERNRTRTVGVHAE
ncbi:MAG: hypothetical protein PSV22_17695 [Pseudolabrys sp.]|nr:hypothetical protein [Pseudolabrys sp.]